MHLSAPPEGVPVRRSRTVEPVSAYVLLALPAAALMSFLIPGCAPHMGSAPSAAAAPIAASAADVTPAGAGYATPENLVYDADDDVYLVANVNGGATARDANGFISRVAPDGRIQQLKWIDGTRPETRLDGPKGLAIRGDTLVVADVGAVRRFNVHTGAPLGVWPVPGVLLNDVSFAPDGTLYVTETGPAAGSADTSSGHQAIWRFDREGHPTALVQSSDLGRPDGIIAMADGEVIYATFGSDQVVRIAPSGAHRLVATLPGNKVDGLRRLPSGAMVATSWDAHAVFRVMDDGTLHPLLTGVKSPAGVAVDTRRNQLAVTSMQDNRFYLVSLR